MKNKLRLLPVPLQNLLIYRVALAILALGASLALAVFLHDVHFALPGLILCVTMLVSASLLYQLLIQGRYLALRGTVLNAEQTMIRKHTSRPCTDLPPCSWARRSWYSYPHCCRSG